MRLLFNQPEGAIHTLEIQLRATVLVDRILLDIPVVRALLAPHPWIASTSSRYFSSSPLIWRFLLQDPLLVFSRLEFLVLVHLLKLCALALVKYSSPSLSSEIKQQARALVLLLVDVEDIHNGPEP